MKVLQLCHKMPVPPSDGGAQVMHFTTLGLLSNAIEVKTLSINPTRNFIEVESLPHDYLESTRFEAVKVDTTLKPLAFLLNLFKSESYFIERFISKDFELKLESVLRSEKFDIIQLEHLYLCKYIEVIRSNSKAKIILRPQNVEYVIWERYLKNLKHPLKKYFLKIATSRLKKYEQTVNEQLDGIIALTSDDAEIFNSFSKKIPVIVCAMGYDYKNLEGYDFEKQFSSVPSVYHLGGMDWLPNSEAIYWFLKEVFPILNQSKLNFKITLAGRNMPQDIFDFATENLEIYGNITQPLKFQEDKPIMIVPLLSGSGIRAKIIEGLALGKTIISTSIGAQGIAYQQNINMLIADSPQEFAAQIIRCIESPDLCKTISKNARLLSKQFYHSDSTAKKMIEFYTETISNGG